MKKVLITQRILPEGMKMLEEKFELIVRDDDQLMSREEVKANIKDVDALVCMMGDKINEELLKEASKLKIVSNYAVGYDNIDVKYLTERGIYATNTPGVLSDATADIAWALMLAAARRVVEADKIVRNGRWVGYTPTFMLGKSISKKTLGIIGAGRIGQTFAKRSTGFDMKVLYHNRKRNYEFEEKYNATYVDKDTLLKESDFISLHVPLTDETRNMISEREFKLMKKTAVLVNTARGPVVNEKDLIKALKNKDIWSAGLDVYNQEPNLNKEFLELDNVVVLPHIGSADDYTREKMSVMVAENIIEVLEGKKPITPVNQID